MNFYFTGPGRTTLHLPVKLSQILNLVCITQTSQLRTAALSDSPTHYVVAKIMKTREAPKALPVMTANSVFCGLIKPKADLLPVVPLMTVISNLRSVEPETTLH